MPEITISEALAELKLTKKKIEQKRQFITTNTLRSAIVKDPFETEGGSLKKLRQERQAINDLSQNYLDIRTAIQNANSTHSLTVENETKTITEWLIWRRELAEDTALWYRHLTKELDDNKRKMLNTGKSLTSSQDSSNINEVIINFPESEIFDEYQKLVTINERLDGKLSAFNATTVVKF